MDKQHFQLPNEMGFCGLNPKDQLVYVCIRSYMNKDTMECFPSLETLKDKLELSIPTLRTCIKRLEEKGYISVKKDGRKNIYRFNKLVKFEPFSKEFLENKNISPGAKAFVAASQQYMYKDVEGEGKLSISNKELAEKINSSETSVRRYNKELERKNYLTILKNESRELETGCKTETKLYHLNDLGQAIIWTLQDHEDRITNTESRIERLEKEMAEKDKLIRKLLKDRAVEDTEFTM